jgi:hypothetical protein
VPVSGGRSLRQRRGRAMKRSATSPPSKWKLSWLRRFPVCSSLDFRVFFELFSLVFRARLVPLILRCLGSNLLVGIMDSCLVHLCA